MDLDRDHCYRALRTRDARFDGRFFTAVRTTGIYCRPICPARTPNLENVEFMPSAAAAEAAGFRPCLRCRPETSPELAAWRGTANTVTRALRLIAQGDLDDADLPALCDRLGVGERHLRRLFDQYLGASPKAVAMTRRMLFAKQLITETGLSMAEIALASGFGSVRRFNDAFLRRYGHAPGRLRRRAAPRGADDAIRLRLPLEPPYDWASMSQFLASHAVPGVEVGSSEHYARTIEIDGASGWFEVRPWPSPTDVRALDVRIAHRATASLAMIVERIKGVFDLGADPAAIDAQLGADPILRDLVAARPGLRVPGTFDGLELALRAVLGQQVSVAAAIKLATKLVERHGHALDDWAAATAPAGLSRVFPNATTLAAADLLTDAGMPPARARTLGTLAAAAVTDPTLFEPGPGLEASLARLVALAGIGPWTAQYIAMRAMREPDAFPHGDVALLRAVRKRGDPDATQRSLSARSAHWQPWRAYATLHLWMTESAAPTEPASKESRHARRRPRPLDRSPADADRADLARVR